MYIASERVELCRVVVLLTKITCILRVSTNSKFMFRYYVWYRVRMWETHRIIDQRRLRRGYIEFLTERLLVCDSAETFVDLVWIIHFARLL